MTATDEVRFAGEMDATRARELVDAERTRVQQLLADLTTDKSEDEAAEAETGDSVDPAQPLTQFGVDDAVAVSLRDKLAALDRASARIDTGTYGRSIRSGAVIPDERLEADPAAELTVQEQAADEAALR